MSTRVLEPGILKLKPKCIPSFFFNFSLSTTFVISAHGWLANNRTEREMLRHPLALETTRNSTANGPFSITEIFVTISAKGWFSFAGSQVKVSAPSLPT